MADDRAEQLRKLADDLREDAEEFDATSPHEGGIVEGLGRAAGRVQARADELDGQ